MKNNKIHRQGKKHKGMLLIRLGLLLIAVAFCFIGYNFYDEYRARESSGDALASLEEYLPDNDKTDDSAMPDYMLNPDMEMPTAMIDGIDYIGVLSIPALDLELPIISQWSYPNLRIAPCRYSGSAYSQNLVIAAHNYSTHFGNLKNLQVGDEVIFTDMDGNTFTYKMEVLEILEPTATEEMKSEDWDLTLFTCTIGGQSRVTVRCILDEK